jgi:hypothetical protein
MFGGPPRATGLKLLTTARLQFSRHQLLSVSYRQMDGRPGQIRFGAGVLKRGIAAQLPKTTSGI